MGLGAIWLAARTFMGPVFSGLLAWAGRVLSDWRVIAPLIVAALLWASYGAGRHVGRIETEAGQKDGIIAAQGARLATQDKVFADLESLMRGWTAAQARRATADQALSGRLDDYFKRINANANHAGCVLDADDARLLGAIDRPAAAKSGGAAIERLPGH